MLFTTPQKKATHEERLARLSMGFLGGSGVIVAVFVALAFTIATKSVWIVLAVACLVVYVAQFYYLGSIGRYAPKRRLQIWQLSLLGHMVLFGLVLWVIGDPSIALVVLLPEAVSFAIHLLGIYRADRALQSAAQPLH